MLTLHIVYDDVGSSQPNAIQQNGECECHLAEKIFTARNSSKEVVIYIYNYILTFHLRYCLQMMSNGRLNQIQSHVNTTLI